MAIERALKSNLSFGFNAEGWAICSALVSLCSAAKIKMLSSLLPGYESCNFSSAFPLYILLEYSS